jgi:two-component system nitrate/nitrite response regulator NarL
MAQVTSFPQQDRVRVLAADNTSMNTQLLAGALAREEQFNMTGSGSKPAEILAAVKLAAAKKEHPHVALISARQEENATAGFALCRDIRSASPKTRVILLLDSSERAAVLEAFRCGARGVFFRTESLRLLAKCVLCVHEGQVWAGNEELHYLLEAINEPAPIRLNSASGNPLLSARELDVVRCLAEGLTNREIGQRLTLTEHTVKNYLFRIFDKLGVSSRIEVVLYALSGSRSAPPQSNFYAAPKKQTTLAPVMARSGSPISAART